MNKKTIESNTKVTSKTKSNLISALKLSLDYTHTRVVVKDKTTVVATAELEDLIQKVIEDDNLNIKAVKEWHKFFVKMSDLFGTFLIDAELTEQEDGTHDKCL